MNVDKAAERYLYHGLEQPAGPFEIIEKGSRFLAYAFPSSHQGEIADMLKSLRKKYHDSTHVCHAARFLAGGSEEFRYSDDGEPSGTAGLPMLNEMRRFDLFNAVTAVIRYFGGVKLGTGGLVRAYSGCLRGLLEGVSLVEKPVMRRFRLEIPFVLTGVVMPLLDRFSTEVMDRSFSEAGQALLLEIPLRSLSEFTHALDERTAGKVQLINPEGEKPGNP